MAASASRRFDTVNHIGSIVDDPPDTNALARDRGQHLGGDDPRPAQKMNLSRGGVSIGVSRKRSM
jgi:hypothetical protein